MRYKMTHIILIVVPAFALATLALLALAAWVVKAVWGAS